MTDSRQRLAELLAIDLPWGATSVRAEGLAKRQDAVAQIVEDEAQALAPKLADANPEVAARAWLAIEALASWARGAARTPLADRLRAMLPPLYVPLTAPHQAFHQAWTDLPARLLEDPTAVGPDPAEGI